MPLIPETWRDQQQVNTTTTGTQDEPVIIQLANGNILVAWTSTATTGVADPAGDDIVGQIYDPLGNRVGGEFRLNLSSIGDNEQHPSLAAATDGGFFVAYWDRDIGNAGGSNLRLERFNANGSFNSGALIISDSGANAAPNYSDPVVAVSSATSVLVVWEEALAGGDTRLAGRIYNPTTDTLGATFAVLSSGGNDIIDAEVTTLANGNYVIVAVNNGVDDSIAYRIMSPTGGNVLGYSTVSGTNTDGQLDGDPSVTALPNGNFVISFINTDTNTEIGWRLYNATGTQIDSGFAGPVSSTSNNNEPAVVGLADGTFVVIFDNDVAGSLQVQRFSGVNGNSLGTFTIAATAPSQISATALDDGRFAVTWVTNNGSGEIAMEILDTRDNANPADVYSPDGWQVGTVGNDTFTVDSGAEIINGWTGNDTITHGDIGGVQRVSGGDGNDIIRVQGAVNDDSYEGGFGIDTIDWSGTTELTGITINLLAGTVSDGGATESAIGFENAVGSNFNDTITGNNAANRLTGGLGDDTLSGGTGTDTLVGGNGSDTYLNVAGDTITELNGQGFDRIITDQSVSILSLGSIERVEMTGAIPGFLRGNSEVNTLIGNSGSNTIEAYSGNDTILGLGGRDTITGGLGRDTIAPGLERDTVRWTAVAESTGPNRDVVSEFIFSSGGPYESLDFTVVPTFVAQTITTGALSEATFDANMVAAVNASRLGAGQAVLFDPSSGDLNLPGHIYLIVDANNVAGYQAGLDYVVQFTSSYGTLTTDNFI